MKWTDNLLSQHDVPDVSHRQRGVARGVSWSALVRIAIIRELHLRLGCGVRESVAIAEELLAAPGGVRRTGPFALTLDRLALEQTLRERLKDALESAPRPRRGRPPARNAEKS